MTPARAAIISTAAVAGTAIVWLLLTAQPWQQAAVPGAAAPPPPPAEDGRKIKVRLFYVSEDGSSLQGVEHDVPFAEDTAAQARAIVEAQIAPPPAPLVSAVPPGTTLRALFVTGQGQAFVDFGPELTAAHPGGSLTELLTIYTLVDALTVNMPAITAVQVLVDGKEVDTLAGHVDLRQPLVKNLTWVDADGAR
jgi:hypothetical protein